MKSLSYLSLAFSLGVAASPLSAQLVHLSLEPAESWLLFHADSSSIPWHTGVGWITEFDLHYDARQEFGSTLDPSRNYWHMHVEAPELRNFDITRPIQNVLGWSDSDANKSALTFTFGRFDATHFETMELNLFFNQLIPTTGKLPLPPFPALGTSLFGDIPSVFIQGGRSYFDFPHLTDFYGGAQIASVNFEITPVPEPAEYSLAAVLLLGAILARRKFSPRLSRAE